MTFFGMSNLPIAKDFTWKGDLCRAQWSRYGNMRPALVLISPKTGEVIVVATVNLADLDLEDREIAIKNYNENAGVLDALVEQELLWPPHRWSPVGYVQVPICRIRLPDEFESILD